MVLDSWQVWLDFSGNYCWSFPYLIGKQPCLLCVLPEGKVSLLVRVPTSMLPVGPGAALGLVAIC